MFDAAGLPTLASSWASSLLCQVFDVDAFAHALPAGCAWWEGELGAGEMIFIPEEWPVTRPELRRV